VAAESNYLRANFSLEPPFWRSIVWRTSTVARIICRKIYFVSVKTGTCQWTHSTLARAPFYLENNGRMATAASCHARTDLVR
jgi:hypothetical protein